MFITQDVEILVLDAQMAMIFFLDDNNSDSDSRLATSALRRKHQHGHGLRKGAALKPFSSLSAGNISKANENGCGDLFAATWKDTSTIQQAQQVQQVRQQYGQVQQSTMAAQRALMATSSMNSSRLIKNRVMANANVNVSSSQPPSQSQQCST